MPPVRRGSGRGRGNRARKAAAVQPRELKQPQMQSHEKPGNAEEKIPSIPSVGGDIQQSFGQKSPAQSQGIEHDSEHGNITDTDDSDEDPLPTSKTNAYTSQKSPETKKYKSCDSNRRDYKKAMKRSDPQIEKDLVEFYKTNPCHLDLRQDLKKKLIEDISKSTGVAVIEIIGWWKGARDTFTRLSQKKSGEERHDLPYKQKWLLENLAFLRERTVHRRAPIKSLRDLADDNPVDLDAVEKLAAKQGKANNGSTPKGKGKSSKKSWQAEEDAEISALQQTAKDSVRVLESLKESIDTVAVKRDESSDRAALYGQHLINEMRQMSKRCFKIFRKEVEASLAKYNSSTDSDDDCTLLYKKYNTETTKASLSSSSRLTLDLLNYKYMD